jgi:hypothetical protein
MMVLPSVSAHGLLDGGDNYWRMIMHEKELAGHYTPPQLHQWNGTWHPHTTFSFVSSSEPSALLQAFAYRL